MQTKVHQPKWVISILQKDMVQQLRMNWVFFGFIFCIIPGVITAQIRTVPLHDTSYYKTFEKYLIVHSFLTSKYTSLGLTGYTNSENIRYMPNTPLSVGLGVTYNFLTLNLGVGLGFLNNNSEEFNTNYLDLQTHIYIRKVSLDLYGQFYKGYYLPGTVIPQYTGKNYFRPDLNVNFLGIAGYYIFNSGHFSYRASLVQDEWQKKSSGSLLLGGEIYYGSIYGDSDLIPGNLQAGYSTQKIHRVHFFEIGPGAGYAYTFVFQQHFFLTGAINLNAAFAYNREFGISTAFRIGINPNFTYRAIAGYNGNRWAINLSWINNQISFAGLYSGESYRIKTGMYNLTVNYRFKLERRVRRKINHITDKIKQLIPNIR
ncbi:MAG TPA: DUF4421 domain-containing protein [Chitinophagaceae bacterium]|nr:DUF4421 domain-containing protein [Chitinophagaceae bacterium]